MALTFAKVAASELPKSGRGRSRSSVWHQIVEPMRELEIGEAISVQIGTDELAAARAGIRTALRAAEGDPLFHSTRTAPVAGDDSQITLYIVRTES